MKRLSLTGPLWWTRTQLARKLRVPSWVLADAARGGWLRTESRLVAMISDGAHDATIDGVPYCPLWSVLVYHFENPTPARGRELRAILDSATRLRTPSPYMLFEGMTIRFEAESFQFLEFKKS